MSFFDQYGFVNSRENQIDTNGVLFTAYYLMLKRDLKFPEYATAYKTVCQMEESGEYPQDPRSKISDSRKASHDNIVAICYHLSLNRDNIRLNRLNISHYYKYLQVISFLLTIKVSKYFTYLNSLQMLTSCWRNYKAANGKPELSGKLLSLLKIATLAQLGVNIPFQKQILAQLFKHYGVDYIYKMFAIYFDDPKNPIRLEAFKNVGVK